MNVVHDGRALEPFHGGALVPTMGALHDGHRALVAQARRAEPAGPVVLSIFVNPTQFAPNEDFDRYPRAVDTDLAAARDWNVDVAFLPRCETIYPPDAPVAVPPLPAVATEPGLEDALRPGHLAGVCQVVARLFDLARPRRAFFGEKDYQQLCTVRALVAAEAPRWGDLEIHMVDTVREPDGLAMSSRNRYLSTAERDRALGLSQALTAAGAAEDAEDGEARMRAILEAHDLAVEYAVVRAPDTLAAPAPGRPQRGLIAARLGKTRLIDTMGWT